MVGVQALVGQHFQQNTHKKLGYSPLLCVVLLLARGCLTENVMRTGEVGHDRRLCLFTQLLRTLCHQNIILWWPFSNVSHSGVTACCKESELQLQCCV